MAEKIPIQFTAPAIKELKRILRFEKLKEGEALRVGVKSGGCQGLSYVLGFDSLQENDLIFQVEGITVYINKAHLPYLEGVQIDFHNGLNNRGFIFENPKAKAHCGCGKSFTTE